MQSHDAIDQCLLTFFLPRLPYVIILCFKPFLDFK